MAAPKMMKCPTCAHQVSTSALSCPSCGAVLRKARRGFFGKLVIFAFWGFNLLMIAWIWGATSMVAETGTGLTGAEAAGHAIGTGLGMTMIVIVWMIGAIILGLMALLTRAKS
jgi:hypothetical protein